MRGCPKRGSLFDEKKIKRDKHKQDKKTTSQMAIKQPNLNSYDNSYEQENWN